MAEGLRAQDIEKLRDDERSLRHLADYLRVHKLYERAKSARDRERDRRAGKCKLMGAICTDHTFGILR